MAKLVFLEYMFLMDPAETFQHRHQLERALADFFASKGMQADIIRGSKTVPITINAPVLSAGKRVLQITRMDKLDVMARPEGTKVGKLKGKLDKMRTKKLSKEEERFQKHDRRRKVRVRK